MKKNIKEFLNDILVFSIFYFLDELVHYTPLYIKGPLIYIPYILLMSGIIVTWTHIFFMLMMKPKIFNFIGNIVNEVEIQIKSLTQVKTEVSNTKKIYKFKSWAVVLLITILFVLLTYTFYLHALYITGASIVMARIYLRNKI